MKKRLLVNNKLLRESSIKVGDKDYQVRLRRRIVDLRRVADMAKVAADKAEKADNTELAKKLNDRVEEIEKLLDTYNIDTLDPEEIKSKNTDKDDPDKSREPGKPDDPDKPDKPDGDPIGPDGDPGKPDDPTKPDKPDGPDGDPIGPDGDPIGPDGDPGKPDDPDGGSGGGDGSGDGPRGKPIDKKPVDPGEPGKPVDPGEPGDPTKPVDPGEPGGPEKPKDEEENEGSDDEEDDSDEEETNDTPVKDPFADEEDIPDLNLGGGTQEPRDATLKDIIKQLKGLPAESKRGALAALQDIINSRKPTTESLTEAVKGIREMTDDEFGDYINSTYDLIDQVEPLQYEDEEELKKKKARIDQWSTDPKTLKELEAEDNVSLERDFRREKAREKENSKYNKSYVGTLEEFKLNFYNAIKHQVEMVTQEYQSYDEINAEYESEDIIMKADLTQTVPEEVIPVIDIYFDVSGSWEPEDIEIGKKAVATVKEFEDAGEIKLNIFYFSNGVGTTFEGTRARYGKGTSGWKDILQNIKATEAQNVLIMTDDDIEDLKDAKQGPTCKVDGCVWFLWRNGKASPSCVSHLIGRQGNYQYAFYR